MYQFISSIAGLHAAQTFYTTFVSTADASDEEGLEADLSFIGSHAFARMEGDVDKQRRLILQGQLSEAALQKQHQRKWEFACSCEYLCWLGPTLVNDGFVICKA